MQWTPPNGVLGVPGGMGTFLITAEPDCLVLTVGAADPAGLARWQQIVRDNVERFAAREGPTA